MILKADGFDNYAGSDFAQRGWTSFSRPGNISAAAGRFGGQAIKVYDQCNIGCGIGSTTTFIGNFALNSSFVGAGAPLFYVSDGSRSHGLVADASGNISYQTNADGFPGTGTIRASSTGASMAYMAALTWTYFEVKIVFATTAVGSVQVKMNGVTIINATNIITASAGSAFVSAGFFATNGQYVLADDVIFMDNTGSDHNDFIGERRAKVLYPTANGRVNAFGTQVGGTTGQHYTAVSEALGNDGATYLEDGTIGNAESFAVGALPSTITSVDFVQVVAQTEKSDAGTRAIQLGVGNGTTELYNGTDLPLIGGQYGQSTAIFKTNPLTSAPWAPGDFSTLQVAAKITA